MTSFLRPGSPRLGRLGAAVLAAALVGAAAPSPAPAQDPAAGAVRRAVVGSVFDSTSAVPLRGAAVYIVGTTHVAMTDTAGRFLLPDVEAGVHTLSLRHARLDTLGIAAAPQWRIEVAAEGLTRVALAVPSLSTLMPGLCLADPSQRGILMGVVRDGATGTPLPEAVVSIGVDSLRFVTETDREGRFVECGLPTGVPLTVRTDFLRRAPSTRQLVLQPDRAAFEDFRLDLSRGVAVTGTVVDDASGSPVDGALIRLETAAGEQARAVTDPDGDFRFDALALDTYLVEVSHIAYGTQVRWFTIDDVTPVELRLGLVAGAVELEALVVTVSAPEVERARRSGVRSDFVSRQQIEVLLGSAQNVGDLVRTMPAVRVSNTRNPRTGQMELCVEARRSYGIGCDPVTVILDGVRSDAELLMQLPPQMIESLEFIPSIIAGVRYGGRTGSGVLEVTTIR